MTNRTTESLREMLFSAIENIADGKMDPDDGKVISLLSERIIKSAELEIKFSETTSRLDKEDQGINIGPVLLTSEKK